MSFYDEVLREIVLAVGAALFLANAYALTRRRADAERTSAPSGARARRADEPHDLSQAPLARTVTYMLIGLVVAIWALASIVS